MPIYLSGHLHNRNVTVDEGLVELVLEKYTSNPSCYGMITVGDDGAIGYEPKTVDISLWARETGRTDEQSLLFSEIEQEAWRQNSEETVEILSEGYDLTAEEKADAVAFFDEILLNLSRGSVYRERGALATHPGYEPFWKIAEHSNYGPWIKSLFENSNPYTEGFVIRR